MALCSSAVFNMDFKGGEVAFSTPASDQGSVAGEAVGTASDSQISKFEHSNTMESSLDAPGDESESLMNRNHSFPLD